MPVLVTMMLFLPMMEHSALKMWKNFDAIGRGNMNGLIQMKVYLVKDMTNLFLIRNANKNRKTNTIHRSISI